MIKKVLSVIGLAGLLWGVASTAYAGDPPDTTQCSNVAAACWGMH
ncbi:hypothetical protein ACFVWG_08655 [Kribbella sp. NPDC058245]